MKRKNGMIWLEMISIRTAGVIEAAKVFDICRQSFQSIAVEKLLKLTVYCNAKYTTDISIHLQWKSDPGPRSILGSHVSSALGDLGLISHTLWIEQEKVITDNTSEISSSKRAINMKKP
ncbi:MAG: hypothetical protein ABSG91_25450 [Syntrophobacteraceae bacterium]